MKLNYFSCRSGNLTAAESLPAGEFTRWRKCFSLALHFAFIPAELLRNTLSRKELSDEIATQFIPPIKIHFL